VRIRSIADLASAVRGRRIDLELSQTALARRTGISRKWISEFEAGKATAELALVLRILEALGFKLELDIDTRSPAAPTSSSRSAATETRPAHTPVDLDTLLEELRKR